MKIAYYCVQGSSLAWALRLQDEGADVRVYQQQAEYNDVGRDLVPLIGARDDWMTWGLADKETLWFFDCTSTKEYDVGALGDRLRKAGRLVVGAGAFMDRLECDRAYGAKIAQTCGVLIPPTHEFSSVADAMVFITRNPKQEVGDGGWAWKPDRELGPDATCVGDPKEILRALQTKIVPRHGDRIKCIVQERVKGVPLSTARWWNGMRFTGPFEGTIEHKKFATGDVGPSTGCALNLVWFYREPNPKIAQALAWDQIEQQFRAAHAPPGLYDINAIIDQRGAWFLEWTPRLGIDSELTSQRGITNLAEMLLRLAHGHDIDDLFDIDRIYGGVRLSVLPYPFEGELEKRSPAMGLMVDGADGLWENHFVAVGVRMGKHGLEIADPSGFVGVALAAGDTLDGVYDSVYAYLKDTLRIDGLCYRTDAADVLREDVEAMAKTGWLTSDVLEEAA